MNETNETQEKCFRGGIRWSLMSVYLSADFYLVVPMHRKLLTLLLELSATYCLFRGCFPCY